MQVTIDGVHYSPANTTTSRIGIAISTHNRADVLKRALSQHIQYLPTGALVVAIDDGSKPAAVVPDGVKLLRHETSLGIVASKNASLSALMDAGCEHLFLWDDDAWPIADNWHLPYIESPEPHLAYQFLDLAGRNKLNDLSVLYRDDQHVAYTGQRGVMLYYHRSAIDKVGGFDPVYGRGMYEHPDLALRIHNAGLSTWAFADVAGSEDLIHSMDEYEEGTRSIPRPEREALAKSNAVIYSARRDSGYTAYVPFRKQRDVVITSFLTSQNDPQRQRRMKASPELVQGWATSIRGADAVVLADELETAPRGANIVRVPTLSMSPYFARWLHIYQYLRANPDITHVWCTDGTDVEMLREPWEEMEPGKIYVGSEHKTYAEPWMKANHHGQAYSAFIVLHRHEQLLNAGLLGGSRTDVMEFAHRIIRQYYLIESHRFWKMETAPATLVDMGAFGMAAKSFGDRIVTGPLVHTIFKTDGFGKEVAWWKHK
ncbi:TPA: glycosyltransferase family 2 protein [Salmonella enterica]|uniref:glycosyltransferase family 2 protein n=1 Tax=Salmonella TaxID=590 RepID=UPI0017A66EA2|nr:glycosyltransferase family 2 protein [Salmonella enterica]EDT5747241.1 glycosyltransferase family 2 protein [Salmonella enterica subsp. enterica serovar Cerro]EDT8483664.1 glycosyltransferase family 2 protein [Salmonella enterica subsp. enterica serovar Cerro]EEJ2653330.1 glycosyltransferase family 2 protein [Salmonella enterica subsp. enterica serovar Cerro]EIW5801089.1 glycosyltransferase family 2 protein [Salmonella enterica]EJE9711592.1 glycosyltransferase family 2 protein [Salmonella e